MTQALAARGCQVTAVERDEGLAGSTRPFCARLIISDVESPELAGSLKEEQFDAILLGDVLEHLRDPQDLLVRLRSFLAPGGCVVASLPNVAHASVRLALLQGRFDYQPEGLLDRTHLRFFTLASLRAMFHDAGYAISNLLPVRRGFFDTEIPVDAALVPLSILHHLCRDPEALAYQYVLRARPVEATVPPLAAVSAEAPADARGIRSELAWQYRRMGIEALFADVPDSERARRLLYRAFRLAPSPGVFGRLCASLLPRRILRLADQAYGRLRRRPGANR
jgi:SAM-dependent methyltransferase